MIMEVKLSKVRNRRDFLKEALVASVGMGITARTVSAFTVSGTDFVGNLDCSGRTLVKGNPFIPGRGVCDPQIRVYDGRVYLYATHDFSPENHGFRMLDWWIWSTTDLVHWDQVNVLRPEQTFLAKPFSDCWATDAATRNGKFFFYFSAGPEQIGVVTSSTPVGPWKDPLGKPLIPRGLTPTEERDPGILMDDDGAAYIIFGTWDYYIARLTDDMISLAEMPRLIELDHKAGPYGEGKTDDKPFLHKRSGIYYLSWGCFYAIADSPYGPFTYKGTIINPENTAPEFRNSHLLLDRHGSFFEFNGQWYFACNDYSRKGSTAQFRDSILSYVHYRDNGELAPIRIDGIGVGRYDSALGRIEAEDYFKLTGGSVRESLSGGFEVRDLANKSVLLYANVHNVPSRASVILHISSAMDKKGRVEIREKGLTGKLLGHAAIPSTGSWDNYLDLQIPLASPGQTVDLAFVFRGGGGELARLDSWRIADEKWTLKT